MLEWVDGYLAGKLAWQNSLANQIIAFKSVIYGLILLTVWLAIWYTDNPALWLICCMAGLLVDLLDFRL